MSQKNETSEKAESVTISCQLFDRMLAEGKDSADLIALYLFYYRTARRQKTDTPKALNIYVEQGLSWGNSKVKKIKSKLEKMGLIQSVCRRDSEGEITGWYVKVNYIWRQSRGIDSIPVDDLTRGMVLPPVVVEKQMLKVSKSKCLKERKRREENSKSEIQNGKSCSDGFSGIPEKAPMQQRNPNSGIPQAGVPAAGVPATSDLLVDDLTPKLVDVNNLSEAEIKGAYAKIVSLDIIDAAIDCDTAYLADRFGKADLPRHLATLSKLTPARKASYGAYLAFAVAYAAGHGGKYPIRPKLDAVTAHDLAGVPSAELHKIAAEYAGEGDPWAWFGSYVRSESCGSAPQGPDEEHKDADDGAVAQWIGRAKALAGIPAHQTRVSDALRAYKASGNLGSLIHAIDPLWQAHTRALQACRA